MLTCLEIVFYKPDFQKQMRKELADARHLGISILS